MGNLKTQMDVLIHQENYEDLIRQSEQLRILKNFAKNEKIFIVDLLKVVEAMEGKANE